MNNVVTTLAPSFLQAKKTPIKSRMGSKFGRIRSGTNELPALERLKNPHRLIMRNVVTSLLLSILNRSSSYLQIRRTTVEAWMSLNFVKFSTPFMEFAVLEHLKN